MPSYRQTRAYAIARNAVAERGRHEFDRLARAIDLSDPDALQKLQKVADAVMRTYGAASAELAAQWFALCAPDDAAPAALVFDASKRKLHEGIAYKWSQFASDEIGARGLMDGCTAKAKESIVSAAAETLFEAIASDVRTRGERVQYVRVASGDSCAFCALLAAEDRTFSTEDAAAFDAHDGCMCVAMPYHTAEDVDGYDRSRYSDMYERAKGTIDDGDYPDELRERIEAAKAEHDERYRRGEVGARWNRTNETLVVMRYQNGLK